MMERIKTLESERPSFEEKIQLMETEKNQFEQRMQEMKRFEPFSFCVTLFFTITTAFLFLLLFFIIRENDIELMKSRDEVNKYKRFV